MRGTICAVNGRESHSGMNALRALVAPASHAGRFFAEVKVTGTHAASIAMVQSSAADIAAIDCVTHALILPELS
jgi:ABC-type phosphate/phosphonate transport system substrate-binding protein